MASKERSSKKVCLSIEGEMTIYRAAELSRIIAPALATNGDVEVDLSRVTEMDSCGLQVMISAKMESIIRHTQLSFVGHSPAVREVLDVCDAGSFFGDPVVIH